MSEVAGSGIARDARGVVTYTVDEPATRNALSTRVLQHIDATLAALSEDDSVSVVVFTGSGTIFSSGADRAELADPTTIARTTELLSSILTRIEQFPVPVVCRVNGAAFGAGLAIVAAADISIATAEAVFALPEVRFGLVAGPAAAACMGRIGQSAALDVLLTGRRFDAAEAQRMHLLGSVVGRDDLDDTVERYVAELLLGDPGAVGATRRLVRLLSGSALAERLRVAAAAGDAAMSKQDGYSPRELARGGVRDIDWRDVPARPRRSLPGSDIPRELTAELGPIGRCVVTLGTFDGVHRGHAEVVRRTVARAKALGLPCLLSTFDPHPGEVIRPGSHPAVLTSIGRRAELVTALGVDHIRVTPFDRTVADLEPIEFVRQILVEGMHVAEVVVGSNFQFGNRAAGTVRMLCQLADRFGFDVGVVELVRDDSTLISATYIRSCIEAGEVALASSALGRPHRVDGVIEHGDHRGRQLGIPTANLSFDRFASVPADGVYAGRAVFLDAWGQTDLLTPLGPAAISVGTNPTFDGQHRRIEAHILDFDGDLSGRRVGLEFAGRLRPMVRFDDVSSLVAQMKQDVEQARAWC
ncbi:MAG TPA: bifunctional riboflavin kinase/FAD synthetase [Mycobacterium sp.]|nr:bifunctional riboflavin kinase/FAD synthetase [Mycobacterium sp.]